MKYFAVLTLVMLLSVTVSAGKKQPPGQKKVARIQDDDTLQKVSLTADKSTSLDSEGSGDYDDEYDYDDEVSSGAGKKTGPVAKDDDEDDDDDDVVAVADDDSLEKAVDVDEKELDVDEDDDDDDDSTPTTTQSSSTPKIKDDIHFVEEDDSEVQIEQEPKTKGKKPSNVDKTSTKQKDDDLYEYYTEYFDDDYDDLGENNVDVVKKTPVAGLPPVIATSTTKTVYVDFEEDSDSAETEKSAIFPPSYIFLIIASALVSFTVFMLAFLVCRRTVAARRQKKLMPFVVSPTSYGPPSLSTTVKSSSIVKNYQRVPTSTKEFLYQQQQQQQQQEQLSEQSLQKLLT